MEVNESRGSPGEHAASQLRASAFSAGHYGWFTAPGMNSFRWRSTPEHTRPGTSFQHPQGTIKPFVPHRSVGNGEEASQWYLESRI